VKIGLQARVIWVMLALLSAVNVPIPGQTAKCPADAEPRYIVLTIGINHYLNNDKWQVLHTAVNDADSLEQVLETKYGYQSYESLAKLTKSDRLRDEKATQEAIQTLIQDDLKKVLCDNDDFILFFSGHGESQPYQAGEINGSNGYLVPFDAKEEGVSKLIEVKAFLESVSHLHARHILVILDACHSGIAIQDARQGMKGSEDYQASMAAQSSRKVIVSALPLQLARDSGSIPGHSLFGGILLQGLDPGLAAQGKDFIADSMLAEFVRGGVGNESHLAQLPDSAPFFGNAGGSLVLKLDQDLAGLYRNAMQNLVTGDDDTFRMNATKAAQRSPDDPLTLTLQYRLALRQGKVDLASSSIEKLRGDALKTPADSGSLPLGRADLLEIKHQLNFWKNALQISVANAAPKVTIHLFTGETEQNLSPVSGSNDFTVSAEDDLYFKLRAKTDATYVYVFLIDKLGRIYPEADFLHLRENPVDIDSERLSEHRNGPEPNDIQEWHFIFSPRQIDASTSSPSTDDLAGATHYVVTVRPKQ